MKYRCLVFLGALAAVVATTSAPLAGQASQAAASTTPPESPYTQPRTAWGDPDLQGIWLGLNQVPLERSAEFGDREFLTDEEIAQKDQAAAERGARNPRGEAEDFGFRDFPLYSSIWNGQRRSRTGQRTSAIIDPPNGRLPAMTPEAVRRYEAKEMAQQGRGEADTWEDRWFHERCISALWAPMVGNWGMAFGSKGAATFEDSELGKRKDVNATGAAGSNRASPGPVRRFLQAPGYVAITMEEGTASGVESGKYRIIPLDRRPALGPKIKQWLGNARGHWEGNTLVVVIKNIYYDAPIIPTYGHQGIYLATGETLTLTERFTRLDENTLEYRYTVDDPGVYVRPYTVLHELTRDDDFKVSPELCQENNWRNIGGQLGSARADEKNALDFATDSSRKRLERMQELKELWAEEWARLNLK